MGIEETLRAYVVAAEGRTVVWGEDDCSAWCAQWVRAATGRPVEIPEYATRDEAVRHIERAGGLVRLWSSALAHAGIYETHAPQMGDVGVVATSRFGDVGVIFAADGIGLWRAANGTAIIRPRAREILGAWRVEKS